MSIKNTKQNIKKFAKDLRSYNDKGCYIPRNSVIVDTGTSKPPYPYYYFLDKDNVYLLNNESFPEKSIHTNLKHLKENGYIRTAMTPRLANKRKP